MFFTTGTEDLAWRASTHVEFDTGWEPLEAYGSLWKPMEAYGSLCYNNRYAVDTGCPCDASSPPRAKG